MSVLHRLTKFINKKPTLTEVTDAAQNPATEAVEIPKGSIRVAVRGEHYSRNKPDSVVLRQPMRFSLTPKDNYQIKMGWPEGEFFNVNTYPSTETTKDNWLGYLPYEGKPAAAKVAKSVYSGKAVTCWGYYDHDSEYGEIDIFLTLPSQYPKRTSAKDITRSGNLDRENIVDKKFCVTTFLPFHSFQDESDLYQFIVDAGGEVSNSLTLNTDYLIDCDPTYESSKVRKAADYVERGKSYVKIITPDEFLELAGLQA
jgi:NAD-dependent DNA ligase